MTAIQFLDGFVVACLEKDICFAIDLSCVVDCFFRVSFCLVIIRHHYAFFNCNLCRNREKFCVATIHLLEHPAHGRDAQQHQSGALSNVKTRQLIRPVVQYAGDRPCVGRTGNNAISVTMSSLLLIKPVQGLIIITACTPHTKVFAYPQSMPMESLASISTFLSVQ
ncbi:hypothetical protein Tsp_08911 [Trichinella spiralis]|uniref:hypothetical protein n=1 Tax=Trichinella spiralis TaxID=6334 RepID=UPI0001EFBF5D|nr:hypothetical protein Tsp_08911 [Trichinella spiralis]